MKKKIYNYFNLIRYSDHSFVKFLFATCVLFGAGLFVSRIVEIPWRSALRGWDNSFYYMWTRSIVIDQDINFINEREINNTIASKDVEQFRQMQTTKTGHLPNKYGIGWGLSSVPFFLIADTLVYIINLCQNDVISRSGYGAIYQVAQQVGHFLYAVIGLICALKICENFFSKTVSRIAILGIWGASMLPYYQCINLSMAHNLTFTLVAICYLASIRLWYDRGNNELKWIALLWFSSGMLVVTRYQAAVYLVFPAIVVVRMILEKRNVLFVFALFPLSLFPVILQLIAWKVIYGSYFVNTYGENEEGFNLDSPAWLEVLFSPNHGLFYWHPLLLVGCIGFLFFAVNKMGVIVAWVVSFFFTYIVNSLWWCWWLGSSFGLRNFEASVLFFMVGFAYFVDYIKSKERSWLFFKLFIIAALVWNINITILYSVNIISRNSAVSWQKMLESTVVFYPSLIGL